MRNRRTHKPDATGAGAENHNGPTGEREVGELMDVLTKVDEAVELLISKGFTHNEAVDWVGFHGYVEAFEVFRGDEPMAVRPNGFIQSDMFRVETT